MTSQHPTSAHNPSTPVNLNAAQLSLAKVIGRALARRWMAECGHHSQNSQPRPASEEAAPPGKSPQPTKEATQSPDFQ